MASILRSSKFVRYIAGFARNIVVNTPREFDGSVVNGQQCLCGAIPRSFAVQAQQQEQNLESYIRRLDQDVRRSGRISRRDLEDVLEEIKSTRSASSSQSLLVIRCCGNLVPEEMPETRTKLVQEIWNTLKKLKVPMDISHYNALLRVYIENEHEFSPTEFLADLEKNGIEPNRVTYQRLIAKYCQTGDIDGATRILEYMREKQLPVNENVFNALINGHSQLGDMDSAYGILGVMQQAGLEPSADTYTTLISGFAKNGDIESVNKMFSECEEKDIFLLDKDYLDIAYSLVTNGHEKHLFIVLDRVRKAFGYNQDAINVILRLINKGHVDTAYTIMQSMQRNTRQDGTLQSTGSFMIRQMIKVNAPVAKIIEICDRLESDRLFERSISFATEASLECANERIAYELMAELQRRNEPIRNHYFWPLIMANAKSKNSDGIIEVLGEMARFNVNPSSETIREYVIPNLKGRSTDILGKLRTANISIGSAACSLLYCMLQKHDMQEAAWIVQNVNAYFIPELIRKPLTATLYKTRDYENYALILRHVYENLDKKSDVENDESVQVDKPEALGRFLIDLAQQQRQFQEIVEPVLDAIAKQGLSISSTTADLIEEKLGEKMTPEISSLLARLSSGELIPATIETIKGPSYTPSSQMNIPQLERLVQNLDAKNQDTKGLKRQLLNLYYRNKDLDKMKALYEEFAKYPDFKYTIGVYVQLMDTSAHLERLEDTLEYLTKIEELDPNFSLDDTKILRVANVFVKNDRFDDAIKFLERPRDIKEEKSYSLNSLAWRLTNYFADKGDQEKLQKVFDTLLEKQYIEINNVNLGPLVKVHLVNKDIDKALEKFEWCCNQYRATPWKNELACQLIQSENAEKLQKLTDLSTAVHGEINSLYDLVFSFVECGRIRQARKILETPGLQSRPQRINVACQRYQSEGKLKSLEGLCEATKDLNHIDRTDIYYQLLIGYTKQNDPEKCLSLWTQMQEEDIQSTDQFLVTLGTYLKSKNISVPFKIPSLPQYHQIQGQGNHNNTIPAHKKDLTILRRALKDNDIDAALEIKRTTSEHLNTTDISLMIEKLVQADRCNEATNLTLNSLDKNVVPIVRVFRFLLNKLANNGDVESIETIGGKLNSETKKLVSFDNRICHANLVAGKVDVYLANLQRELEQAKDDELPRLGEKFPRGGAFGILERHPEMTPQYEMLAKKFAERGVMAPINVLWSHYFVNGLDDKANELWTIYLSGVPRIMFQRVVQHARETNDDVLIEKLIQHLKTSQVTDGALGNAYSCFIDVLVHKENYAKVVETFETAIKSVPIAHINRTAVLRAKESYEKLNKAFDHPIPAKNAKMSAQTMETMQETMQTMQTMETMQTSSSSSSSSDEEKQQKKKIIKNT